MARKIIIEPQKGWLGIDLKELIKSRELIGFLARRDIMSQYKQAFFGISWAIIKPVFSLLAFTLVFGKVARLSSSGIPYPLFALCGLVAWSFFAAALSQSTVSILNNTNLITKVYFPRLVIPIASLGRGLVDFFISLILFAVIALAYGYAPNKTVLFFPLFLFMGISITLGVGLYCSAISVRYHDLAQAIPIIVQWWFWITPVAYGLENIQGKLRILFFLNPMTWIIQGFRWSLLGVGEMDWTKILITALISIFILISGLFYFRKMEGYFADII